MGAKDLLVKSDLQLIVSQVSGDFQTKDSWIVAYLELTKELLSYFRGIEVNHKAREENVHADVLENLGSLVKSSTARAIPMIVSQSPAVWGEKQTLEELHPVKEESG